MQNYNPSNKHNNLGKKILIGGLVVLVLTGSAIAYTQFAPNDEISPVPYNPPAITTPSENTTENQTPAETPISLEEKLADRLAPIGPLSGAQISKYTLDAYEIAYNNGEYDSEMRRVARGSLGRVIDSVVDSIFRDKELGHEYPGFDEYLALIKGRHRYLENKELSGDDLVDLVEDLKNEVNRISKIDKDLAKKQLRHGYIFKYLGAPSGSGL